MRRRSQRFQANLTEQMLQDSIENPGMICARHLAVLVPLLVSLFDVRGSELPKPTIQFTNVATLNSFGAIKVADVNRDGLPEVISEAGLRIYWNQGTNFLAGPATNLNEGFDAPLPLTAADFDNDSDIDLFFARRGRLLTNGLSIPWIYSTILWSTGATGFTHLPQTGFQPMRRGAASEADFDNDGDLDLIISGHTNWSAFTSTSRKISLQENISAGNFAPVQLGMMAVEDGTLTWADYDTDGDQDLLLSGMTNVAYYGVTILYRNDAGTLVNSGTVLPQLLRASASWGDYDNDGDLDLLLAGNRGRISTRLSYARIFRNDSGTFSEVQIQTPNSPPAGCWADFDADGDLDIVLAQSYWDLALLIENAGDGSFLAARTLMLRGGQMLPADFDGDGRIDIASYNLDWPIYVHRNLTEGTNTPPEPPMNLVAVRTNGSVTFSWNAAADRQQTNGLTYNLRIGTSPGGSEVMSAMANAAGQRFISGIGNTGLRTNWMIHKFRPGTYYWSVQAIDHSYAGSPFAVEQTFSVSNVPPVVEVEQIVHVTASSALLRIQIEADNAPMIYFIEYKSTNHSGSTPSSEITPHFGYSASLLLPALHPATTYEVRLVASNSFGVSYSLFRTFTTASAAVLSELPTSFPTLSQYPNLLPVDLDNDGDLDLIQSGNSNAVRQHLVFTNDGGIITAGGQISLAPLGVSGLFITAAADFNNDGAMDLIFANESMGYSFLRENDRFQLGAQLLRARPHQTFPADAENDGDIDILTVEATPLIPATRLNLNDNLETFFRLSPARFERGQIAEWGDYDNDGDHDLLVFGLTNEFQINPVQARTTVVRNDGHHLFTNAVEILPGSWRGAAWIDHDNDGDLDVLNIVATNVSFATTNELKLFQNDGTNGFSEQATLFAGVEMFLQNPIDFNRDGLCDFFTYQDFTGADKLRLFLNQGAGQFLEQDLGLPLLTNFQARFGDVDGDLMPDIIVQAQSTNFGQGRLRVFRNNLVSTNPRPPVPVGLTAVTAPRAATLQWLFPADGNTSNPLNASGRKYTFNLRVGTTPGGSEIMSAMSHPVKGTRYLPQRGNAGQSGTWTVRDLPPGTYYWAVQSVDHAFNGSRFSAEASFTIAPEVRLLQFQAHTRDAMGRYRLTIDGPTRSRVELLQSGDLSTWQEPGGYFYIGSEPVSYLPTAFSEPRFYRLRLLQD